MSEEKPTFKVTDRRLFNADGTPRQLEREEEAPPAAAESASLSGTDMTSAADSPPFPRTRGAEAAPLAAPSEPVPTTDRAAETRPESEPSDEPEAPGGDPTQLANLVMFIASPAAAALGMTEHPGLAPGEVDLPLAKHCIDLLATVEQKTRGNLSAQEQQILEGLLAELRMQYVSLSHTRPQARPRGFSGSDITGGR
jgi:Domain of unknown function (DUF1844)